MIADELLARAAARAAQNPFYLAGVLQAYQEQEKLSSEDLAAWLGCAVGDLSRLGLCRRPDENSALGFAADVAHLANRFGVRAERLAHLLRQTAFFGTWTLPTAEPMRLRAAESTAIYEVPFLMAARDRVAGDAALEEASPSAVSSGETPLKANAKTEIELEENAPDAPAAPEATGGKTEEDNG